MGWKGAVRSIGAAVRAAERDAKRRQRELEKQRKQYEKMQELEQAAYEVDVYNNYIDVLQSAHKECGDIINWQEIVSSPEPKKPINQKSYEKKAKRLLDTYKPGIVDKIFKKVEKKQKKFVENVLKAKEKDVYEHKIDFANWEKAVSDWEEKVKIAQSIFDGDNEAKIKFLEDFNPFSEITTLGSVLSFSVDDNSVIEATVHMHGEEIIPAEVKSLLKSGKLSVKKMPKGKFNELYQDYACSCVLRVANELFAILPDEKVFITAVDQLLNSKTGHMEESPILSVCVVRKTLHSLNMENIDPSDSMSNFIHKMSFKKAKGFEAVERLDVKSLTKE